VEDRRADEWVDGAQASIGTVEPEWWLRMMCGQLAQEAPAAKYTDTRRFAAPLRTAGLLVFWRNRRRIP
jgi:hypothetical protein